MVRNLLGSSHAHRGRHDREPSKREYGLLHRTLLITTVSALFPHRHSASNNVTVGNGPIVRALRREAPAQTQGDSAIDGVAVPRRSGIRIS